MARVNCYRGILKRRPDDSSAHGRRHLMGSATTLNTGTAILAAFNSPSPGVGSTRTKRVFRCCPSHSALCPLSSVSTESAVDCVGSKCAPLSVVGPPALAGRRFWSCLVIPSTPGGAPVLFVSAAAIIVSGSHRREGPPRNTYNRPT
ncbi:hypothetical protein BIW11_05013 [Tropilaelaps mercedesae]|uniref:Uncharacterized protein n=1 Tax=Tropilaelaps mercedesae TaxID=418985 RepID=A0A1V9WYM0_9ACAR|nr:hypothetical protein BIW11_05013 [Tropilaelaps mercedesae]